MYDKLNLLFALSLKAKKVIMNRRSLYSVDTILI